MIKTLEINGLRGLQQFSLGDLGRVNLLVGTNNCGKTTVLEGIQMVSSPGNLEPLFEIMLFRGEVIPAVGDGNGYLRHWDVRRLFSGHEIKLGNRFSLSAKSPERGYDMEATILEGDDWFSMVPTHPTTTSEPHSGHQSLTPFPLALEISWNNNNSERVGIGIRKNGGLYGAPPSMSFDRDVNNKTRLIRPFALAVDEVVRLFESVVLTAEEDVVIEALRTIEPSIERLAIGGIDAGKLPYGVSTRGGLLVRCTGNKNRIPIGSMGDGIWRMLGLALAIVKAEGGVLLVDEIDTGLHYTTMTDMWRMIYRTAKRLDVQVFATTHSRDCVESLATICREESPTEGDVTIQRIERDRATSVSYTEDEIIAVAERGLEVR